MWVKIYPEDAKFDIKTFFRQETQPRTGWDSQNVDIQLLLTFLNTNLFEHNFTCFRTNVFVSRSLLPGRVQATVVSFGSDS